MDGTFDKKLVVLGTGGTIAGLAADANDNVAYTAAQVGVGQLLANLPAAGRPQAVVFCEQIAQVDSKDIGFSVWQSLVQRCWHWLGDPTVHGVVVTHGTDTMEETAFLLHTVLGQSGVLGKPVVLTGAMRPASSLSPDGPQNLVDAMVVATTSGLQGVLVSFAGCLHHALHVQKAHPYRLDAFTSGESGVLGQVEEGVVRMEHAVPTGSVTRPLTGLRLPSVADRAVAWRRILGRAAVWPRVEIVTSHGEADGFIVDALLSHGKASADAVRGIVVAATGNGSVHRELEAALIRAQALGVVVIRASRCGSGRVVGSVPGSIPDAAGLSPVKARIALALEMMLAAEAARGGAD